ncbi:NDR1/HIN1-like protein 26 [Coffea eugenioides]|uniref:NDR1/HIN1-like protein 26 n=1 Tax=Coffea eugenioides TaxID=49369 RepID=UPI000F61266B|nr:NDR1/HIN1-like protein 26 [Coffea eugenioides]
MADQSKTSATVHPPPTTNVRPPLPSNTSCPYSSIRPAPPTHHKHPHNTATIRQENCTFHCLFFTPFAIGSVIFFLPIITLMILDPELPKFRVDSVTVSNFNISPTTPPLLSGHFTVIISARNPNSKLTLSYNHLDAGIYLGSNQLSGTTLPPFALSKKNETSLTANFVAVGAYVDRAESENLVFNLKIQMKVRYKAGFWRRVTWLEAFCPGLSVRTNTVKSGSSSDVWSLIGGARSCEVC